MLKQIISFILPLTVLILIPRWIEPTPTIGSIPSLIGGLALLMAGLTCLVLTIAKFITMGKGTLAPWSPTQQLVVEGLHAYVRNPMILGVLIALLGEALILESTKIFTWAIIFFLINSAWFIVYEEPDLESKFGESYRRYKRNVRRWIPRGTAYKQEDGKGK